MISKKLIEEAKKIALAEAKKYTTPVPFHVMLSAEHAVKLTELTGAKSDIVEIGIYLMDAMLGRAVEQGKIPSHMQMGVENAKELLDKFGIIGEDRENILACVREHHGVSKFSTLESEVCCNADCYRFISVRGFIGAARFVRGTMSFDAWIALMDEKIEEKWNALTLDVCKKELEPQYQAIKELMKEYHTHEL